jgi:hypothetical protein
MSDWATQKEIYSGYNLQIHDYDDILVNYKKSEKETVFASDESSMSHKEQFNLVY